MTNQLEPENLQPAPKKLPSIRLVATGGAGLKILDHLIHAGLPYTATIAIHAGAQHLAASQAGEKLAFNSKTLDCTGQKDNPQRHAAIAEELAPKLKTIFQGTDAVLIVTGLGGSTGAAISSLVAGAAREAGALAVAFATLPFDCEGSFRGEAAQDGLKRLNETASLVIPMPNQKTFSLIEEGTCLKDTFKSADQLLVKSVMAFWRAFHSDNAMGLPFSDICRLMAERSTECSLATAEASSSLPFGPSEALDRAPHSPLRAPHSASTALDQLLKHPMLDGAAQLQQVRALAVIILGGPALAMLEVNRIMEQVHRYCNGVPVMMGASITPELGESLLVALLIAKSCDPDEEQAPAPEAARAGLLARAAAAGIESHFLNGTATPRPCSRFLPPPPALPAEQMDQLLARQQGAATRGRKTPSKLKQTHLPLEIVSKGRFDKSEPTIHKGEDLDVPTYIRRGMALN